MSSPYQAQRCEFLLGGDGYFRCPALVVGEGRFCDQHKGVERTVEHWANEQ